MQSTIHKLIIVITVAFPLALLLQDVSAQSNDDRSSLKVTHNKTTSLVFPAAITSVDRGSRDIIAQKAKSVDNVLQLKAARQSFPQTNLTVITADGVIRQFDIGYEKDPLSLIIHVGDTTAMGSRRVIFKTNMTEFEMKRFASEIVNTGRKIRFVSDTQYKIGLSLHNIFINDDVIFYHFRMKNQSNIKYDVDFFRFYVQDKMKVKRTASQEVDIVPLFIYGNHEAIAANGEQDVVVALHKFTIPDAKYLAVEMFERDGGRNIALRIKNKTIVNARLIE